MSNILSKKVSARIEELLYEQLEVIGEDPKNLSPHLISEYMHCEVYPDHSMVYSWKDFPILKVIPNKTSTGILWRMFTREEDLLLH